MCIKHLLSYFNSLQAHQFVEFQREVYQNINNGLLFERFENGETLYHKLVQSEISEDCMIRFIFVLSDAGLDVNVANFAEKQTCLHLAVCRSLTNVVYCLLQNGADLTLVDKFGLCAYNYARRIENKELSKQVIHKMQAFYVNSLSLSLKHEPTYWIGVESEDINVIRRLINSWCKFKIKKNGKLLSDYAKEKKFSAALQLFSSLEIQMDLCFAVLACNVNKVKQIITNHAASLRMNFKNMKEQGATVMYYAIKQNNHDLLQVLLSCKYKFIDEYMSDELDIDYPTYFAALTPKMSQKCIQLLTPEFNSCTQSSSLSKQCQHDISQLYYKGMNTLRYAMETELCVETLEWLMCAAHCSSELLTIKDPEYLTCKEYAIKYSKSLYAQMIDRISSDYIINDKRLRMQLALNGFNFKTCGLTFKGLTLQDFALNEDRQDIVAFLQHVDAYQKRIDDFHQAIEDNDYQRVKILAFIDQTNLESDVDFSYQNESLFTLNLINSKKLGESQSVLHKAVLRGNFEVVRLLLDLIFESSDKSQFKPDQIRDHCFRTPMHYANGIADNKRIIHLLSQFGFSDNVFDKDGMTPLDFQERVGCQETKDLIKMHISNNFGSIFVEPNPWTWKVWTQLQREKDSTSKQLLAVSPSHTNPFIHLKHQHQHHHHAHAHKPSAQLQATSPHFSSNACEYFAEENKKNKTSSDDRNFKCVIS